MFCRSTVRTRWPQPMPPLYQDQLCATGWAVLESAYQLVTSVIMGKDLFDSYLSLLIRNGFLRACERPRVELPAAFA
jgi:hypothetical protein